jgi:hypothetical protein
MFVIVFLRIVSVIFFNLEDLRSGDGPVQRWGEEKGCDGILTLLGIDFGEGILSRAWWVNCLIETCRYRLLERK